jgi:hypothetical protein
MRASESAYVIYVRVSRSPSLSLALTGSLRHSHSQGGEAQVPGRVGVL